IFLGREKAAGWLRGRQLAIRPMRSEAQLMLEKFGAAIPVRSLVSNLSGGQRQAVSIIRATAWGARLVVMDEPTAALGVQEAKRVLDVMRSLADKGLAILM